MDIWNLEYIIPGVFATSWFYDARKDGKKALKEHREFWKNTNSKPSKLRKGAEALGYIGANVFIQSACINAALQGHLFFASLMEVFPGAPALGYTDGRFGISTKTKEAIKTGGGKLLEDVKPAKNLYGKLKSIGGDVYNKIKNPVTQTDKNLEQRLPEVVPA